MKVISFLGITNYCPTTYAIPGQEWRTRFFPAAVAHFFTPDEILICATPTVVAHQNLADLHTELEERGVPARTLEIPEGHSEQDLWDIFNIIAGSVEEGETVIFDVTYSYRSLPMLTFLVVAYLKAARKVQVEKVLYGAWEARDKENDLSPVFDLSPFVSLLDWLTATYRFVETGDGYSLAKLLRKGVPAGIQMGQDKESQELGNPLEAAAGSIESISQALRVNRPVETMKSAMQLANTLEQALPSIMQRAQPFAMLTEQVVAEYGQFGLDDPTDRDLAEGLRRQHAMIDWYIKRRHIVQAITLAREWMVSLLAFQFEAPVFEYEHGRKDIERALNNAVGRRKPAHVNRRNSRFDDLFKALPDADKIASLWEELTDLRNDIAHAGMRKDARPAAQFQESIKELQHKLAYMADTFLSGIETEEQTKP